jgi:Tol biopolymer transport system component
MHDLVLGSHFRREPGKARNRREDIIGIGQTKARRAALAIALVVLAPACTGSSPSVAPIALGPPSPTSRAIPVTLHGRLVFSNDGGGNIDIYVMDLPKGTVHRLTASPAADFSPTWSPDGTQIAFRSDRTGNDEIFVMNSDGSGQRDLTRDQASDYSPAWSPDGHLIAFASDRADPTGNDIWLMSADGSNPRPLLHQRGIDEYPVWSPDGSRLAFNCTLGVILGSQVGDFEVCVVNADGTGVQRITDAVGISGAAGWSPDGSLIAFSSNRDNGPAGVSPCGDIFVVRADGTGLRKLTKSTAVDCDSSWAADGHILFSSDRRDPGGQSDLWVMNPDGSDPTLVAPLAGEEQDPVLFPGP